MFNYKAFNNLDFNFIICKNSKSLLSTIIYLKVSYNDVKQYKNEFTCKTRECRKIFEYWLKFILIQISI